LLEYQIFAAMFLRFQQNYFYGLTKLFSALYPAKILDLSAKSFFPCVIYELGNAS